MFEFEKELKRLDSRSDLANRTCYLIYDMFDGDAHRACTFGERFYGDWEDNIRNFYELVEDEIPLYALYKLSLCKNETGFQSEYDLEDMTYEEAIRKTIEACDLYYTNRKKHRLRTCCGKKIYSFMLYKQKEPQGPYRLR